MKKNITGLYIITQITYWMLFCNLFVFANPYLQWKGYSPEWIGVILSIASFISVFTQPMATNLIKKYKKLNVKKTLLYSLIFILFLSVLIPYTDKFTSIIFIIMIATLLTTQTLIYIFVFEFINEGYKLNFGLGRGSGSVAFALFSYLLGYLGNRFGYAFSPYVTIVLTILSIILIYIHDDIYEEIEDANKTLLYTLIKKYDGLAYVFIGVFCLFFGHNIVNTYLLQIVENVGGTNYNLGVCLMIAALVEAPVMALYNNISKYISYENLFKISSIMFTVKIFVTYLAPTVNIIYLAEIMQLAAFAIYLPTIVFYINDTIKKEDNKTAQAMVQSFITIGMIVSTLLGGKIIQAFDVNILMIISVIISLLGTITILYSLRKKGGEK